MSNKGSILFYGVPSLSQGVPNLSHEVPNMSHEVPNLSHEVLNLSHQVEKFNVEDSDTLKKTAYRSVSEPVKMQFIEADRSFDQLKKMKKNHQIFSV